MIATLIKAIKRTTLQTLGEENTPKKTPNFGFFFLFYLLEVVVGGKVAYVADSLPKLVGE